MVKKWQKEARILLIKKNFSKYRIPGENIRLGITSASWILVIPTCILYLVNWMVICLKTIWSHCVNLVSILDVIQTFYSRASFYTPERGMQDFNLHTCIPCQFSHNTDFSSSVDSVSYFTNHINFISLWFYNLKCHRVTPPSWGVCLRGDC